MAKDPIGQFDKQVEWLKKFRNDLKVLEAEQVTELKTTRSQIKKADKMIAAAEWEPDDADEKPKANTRPAPKRPDIANAIAEELAEHQSGLPLDELTAAVETRITASGFSRSGLSLRFREAVKEGLQDKSLIHDNGHVRLATTRSSATKPATSATKPPTPR